MAHRNAGPETTAVVVTCGTTRYLRRTLEGIAAQAHIPTRVVIVDIWTSGRDLGTGDSLQALVTEIGLDTCCKVRIVHAPGARTFGDAVRQGLELNAQAQQRADKLHETRTGEIPVIRDDSSPGWLWLLHDDSAPAPEALDLLLRTAESGPSIAVAGAKQRDWAQPERLLEVGIRATSTARRFNPIDDDEIDQGQYDAIDDVLAVGLAGALVRRDVWNRLGGTDPALGPFGDGLEYCRRARLDGYRVVVVPGAIVHHARASYQGLRSYGHAALGASTPDPARSFGARRRAQVYNWLIAAPWWKVPLLLLWLLLLTPARALARFVGKDMVRARAELSAGAAVLSRPDLWVAARRRLRKAATLPASALAVLEADSAEIRRKKREQRRAAADAHALRGAPSELELAERAALTRRRRVAATALALFATLAAAVGLNRLLGVGALSGGSLLPGDVGLGELTALATSWWIPAGDGLRGPADPLFAVLLVPLITGTALSTITTLLVFLAVPAAALTAWLAAGAATRTVGLRVLAALLWAFAPALTVALGQGRVGPVLAHVALQLVALLTARAMGLARRDVILSGLVGARRVIDPTTQPDAPRVAGAALEPPLGRTAPSLGAAAGAALAFAVVAAGAPVLLPLGVAVFVALTVASRARRVLWFVPLPALVIFGPLLTEAWTTRTWHALAASPGAPLGFTPAEPWQAALGLPATLDLSALPDWAVWVPLAPGAVLAVVAVVALLRGTGRARAVRLGWLLAVLGLIVALASPYVTVALDADGAPVPAWPGAGISLATLGLLTAALSGADGVRDVLARHSFGWRHLSAALLAGLGGLAAAVAIATWFVGTLGPVPDLRLLGPARPDATPALADQARASADRTRALALEVRDDGAVEADLWRGEGEQLQHTSTMAAARAVDDPITGEPARTPDDAVDALAGVVAAMAAGSATGTGESLAAHAIGVVLVPPAAEGLDSARTELVARLDATPGLARVTENPSGVIWRVATDGRDSAAQAIARLTLVDHEGTVLGPVPADPVGASATIPSGPAGRTLVLAERTDPDWHATIDGVALAPTASDWRQAFVVPPGSGELRLTHAPPLRLPWLIAQVVVIGAVALLAIPIRRRREVE